MLGDKVAEVFIKRTVAWLIGLGDIRPRFTSGRVQLASTGLGYCYVISLSRKDNSQSIPIGMIISSFEVKGSDGRGEGRAVENIVITTMTVCESCIIKNLLNKMAFFNKKPNNHPSAFTYDLIMDYYDQSYMEIIHVLYSLGAINGLILAIWAQLLSFFKIWGPVTNDMTIGLIVCHFSVSAMIDIYIVQCIFILYQEIAVLLMLVIPLLCCNALLVCWTKIYVSQLHTYNCKSKSNGMDRNWIKEYH